MLALEPLDSLFFRDSRPFNQDDEGLSEARSMFPPFPTVLAGAIRASLGRRRQESWPSTDLGSGPWDTGTFRFGPPTVLRRAHQGAGWEPLFPCPAALLARPCQPGDPDHLRHAAPLAELRLARPGGDAIRCDLGLADGQHLPQLPDPGPERFRSCERYMMGPRAMRKLLRGDPPGEPHDALVSLDTIVADQLRVGLERNYRSHVAAEGMLYTASHKRLRRDLTGAKADCVLGVTVQAQRDDWSDDLEPIFPLGGHGRAVSWREVTPTDDAAALTPETFHIAGDRLHYMVVLISPALLAGGAPATTLDASEPLPGTVVGACLDRPLAFAGWNARTRQAEPNRRFHRPGSTWFLTVDLATTPPEQFRQQIEARQRAGMGEPCTRAAGCGAFLVGTWQPLGTEDP